MSEGEISTKTWTRRHGDEFIEWLDDQEGHIRKSTMKAEWPTFPLYRLRASTGPIVDGEFAYYQHDLRKVAEGRGIID